MSQGCHSETALETVIEEHLLQNGYIPLAGDSFDRERAIFPKTVLAFIRETQPKEWARPEVLHSAKIRDQVLGDFCKWIDTNSVRTLAIIKERCSAFIAATISGKIKMRNGETVQSTPSPSKLGKRVLP